MRISTQGFISAVLFACCLTTSHAQATAIEANKEQHFSQPPEQVQVQSPVNDEEDNKVSINHASAEELATRLKGIGIKKAQKIVEYRQQYGLFSQTEQLQEVPGIGQAIYLKNADLVKL